MSEINYLQILTPEGECAVHGKEHMFRTVEKKPTFVMDGKPVEGSEKHRYICLACVYKNADLLEKEMETVREDVQEMIKALGEYYEEGEHYMDGGVRLRDALTTNIIRSIERLVDAQRGK